MPPINLRDWHSVLSAADTLIGTNNNTIIDLIRGRDVNASERVVDGRKGSAKVCVRDRMLISITIDENATGTGKQIVATRTSVAHQKRCRHSAWWNVRIYTNTSGAEEHDVEPECGCSVDELRRDLPRPTATQLEDRMFAYHDEELNEKGSLLRDLQQELATSRNESAKLREENAGLREATKIYHAREIAWQKKVTDTQRALDASRQEHEELRKGPEHAWPRTPVATSEPEPGRKSEMKQEVPDDEIYYANAVSKDGNGHFNTPMHETCGHRNTRSSNLYHSQSQPPTFNKRSHDHFLDGDDECEIGQSFKRR